MPGDGGNGIGAFEQSQQILEPEVLGRLKGIRIAAGCFFELGARPLTGASTVGARRSGAEGRKRFEFLGSTGRLSRLEYLKIRHI